MLVAGGYIGCLCMANQHPIFYDLALVVTGLALGVAALDCVRNIPQPVDRVPDPTPGLTKTFQEHLLSKDTQKTQAVDKLKKMFVERVHGVDPVGAPALSDKVDQYVGSLKPDLLDLYDEVLWCVVNEGGDYAFRNPYDRGRTIVVRREFAEKALALGFMP